MASIDSLKASDGSGNASVATVQTTRAGGATTIEVDTIQGINTNFHATMGTPHTFSDPVTGEDITIISEATAVDFKGHVDGANLEIDTIAPGYTDAGSEVGDIVIIKPTTQWGDEAAEVLEAVHEDDGTLKEDASIASGVQSLDTLFDGWIKTNETWTYSGWTAGTRIAEITVPTDATTKYQPGMRVKFTQPTDGIKYGIIHKVEATVLHVFLPDGTDFDNEEITAPFFSFQKIPFGFDIQPTLWTVETVVSTNGSQSSPSSSTWYNLGSVSITLGVGSWMTNYHVVLSNERSGTTAVDADATLSTANNSESDTEWTRHIENRHGTNATQRVEGSVVCEGVLNLTAEDVFYLNARCAAGNTLTFFGGKAPTIIRAVSAYL